MRSQLHWRALNVQLHPSQKLQHPEIYYVCVACISAEADNFSSFWDKNPLLGKLSCEERKKTLAPVASIFYFSCKKACQPKSFCLSMTKNHQHQHKGKPDTQK
jgi:hypothetical protein